MSEIHVRVNGRAGCITLNRPEALNALTYDMVLAIESALDEWRDADIDLIILDADGDRAFCAGGDIAEMYETGTAGNFDYGQKFWRDEYRMNAKLFEFPKPVVSFLQGFTMGGGVGVGCHGSHRIVGESSQIAMPECGIGLVPDVGGSLILGRAPGRLGEYLGTTAYRMNAADAIFAGFADYFVPEDEWSTLKDELIKSGDHNLIDAKSEAPVVSPLKSIEAHINQYFAGDTLSDIWRHLELEETEFTKAARKSLNRNAPLAMACAIQIVRRVKNAETIRQALDQEYRYTYRSLEQGDFIEGIRAAIIDKDRSPKWKHASPADVPGMDVTTMLMPLGEKALNWEEMP